MKRVFKILIMLSFVAGLALQACTKDPVVSAPEIRLSQDTLDVAEAGGRLTLTYSIVNPSDDLELTASCGQEWIGAIDTSLDNVLSFDVEANPETGEREAVIDLSYGGASASLVVIQDAHVPDPGEVPPFKITIKDIDIETAVATIVPEDKDMTYTAMYMAADEYDGYGTDDEVFEALVSYYWSVATDMGLSITDFLKSYALLTGEMTLNVKGLYPGDNYTLFVVGMNEKAEKTSSIVNQQFQAKPIEMNGATFDISYDIDGLAVVMNVSPSSDDIYYYYDALKKKDIENMDMSLEESLKEFFDQQIAYGVQVIGLTREEVMMEMLSKGDSSFEYTGLHASSTYVGVAVSVTLQGYLNSEMTKQEFETGLVEMSDNVLTLGLSDIGVDRVTVSITASNEDQYCMMIMPTSTWPGLTPDEYLEKLEGTQALESHLATGDNQGTVKGLSANTEYYVLLFGYQNGTVTTDLVSETFTTLEDGNPEGLQIRAEFSNVKSDSLTAVIIPTPENALYFSTLVEALYTDSDVKDYIDYIAQMYVGFGMAKDRADFLKQVSVRGRQTIKYGRLFSETEYKIAAIGIYSQTGEYATDVLFSESVRTDERVVSDVTINLVADKYFDGDEVAEQYPQYSSGKGKAVIPVKVEVTGDVEKYFYHIFLNDISDPEKDPDDALITVLTTQGGITAPEAIFYCEYDQPFTIVGVAKDKNGLYSKVFRKFVTYTKDGCSDVSEFVPIQTKSSAASSAVPGFRLHSDFALQDRGDAFLSPAGADPDLSPVAVAVAADCGEPQYWLKTSGKEVPAAPRKAPAKDEIIVFVK